MTAYEQGFMDKCAELGINAEALVKSAFGLGTQTVANNMGAGYLGDVARRGRAYVGNKMRTAWNNSAPGKAVNTLSGKVNNAVGKARGYMENLGERIGNDYAAYRQRTDAPSKDQQMMAMRQQLGYNNRVLGNYRRAAGVPHTPTQIPPAPKPTLGSVLGAINPGSLGGGRAVGSLVGRMLGR